MARIALSDPPHRLEREQHGWPRGLDDLDDPPAQLSIAGCLPALEGAVAIVGTRFADEDALEFTRRLAAGIAARGRVVVSGGAAGIDAAAHEGALEAGGKTIAVLATGLAQAYPAHHAPLFAQIAQSGALLSEFNDPGLRPKGWAFLRRNRLVAALAPNVVIVQAPMRSGALSTASWAKRLKRRVFVVPGAPWDVRAGGCLSLLAQGAEICASIEDVLSVGPSRGRRRRTKLAENPAEEYKDDAGLSAQARAVRLWLRVRRAHPDEISAALDLPAAEVQEALLVLMLSGACRQRADGSYETTAPAKSVFET
ncbi:MAG TPA: DNA-processing protein DprA [Polyangiales bacterium]|nr:DNA-processing protein DprA [Polyangiales bacterium]